MSDNNKRPLRRRRSMDLRLALDRVPSLADLGRKIGVCKQAISRWDDVPPERLAAVSRATGLPPSQIRPEFVKELIDLEHQFKAA
jgi:hypothetical protein